MKKPILALIATFLLSSVVHAQTLDKAESAIDFIYDNGVGASNAAMAARVIGIPGFGRHYAVIVGVSRFDDSSLNGLPGADDDALRMYDYLTNEAGFDRVWLITNEEASRDRIAQIIQDELSPQVTSSDRVLFYYTGHGVMKDHGGRQLGYLPLSYSSVDLPSTMISMQTLKQWSEVLFGARQILFILDSCVSGLAGDVMMSEINPTLRRSLSERGHHLISAGTGDQEGYATANGSYFTQALLDGLRGQADFTIGGERDNAITVSELVVYLRDRLRRELLLSKGSRYAMTPQMTVLNNARLGEFFFPAPTVRKENKINGDVIKTGEDKKSQKQLDVNSDEEFRSLNKLYSGKTRITNEDNYIACKNLTFDLKAGFINSLSPISSQVEIIEQLPCWTGATIEGIRSNNGGGVFFVNDDFYFYTSKNYIEIREDFSGSISPINSYLNINDIIDLFGDPMPYPESESDKSKIMYFQTDYGCLLIRHDLFRRDPDDNLTIRSRAQAHFASCDDTYNDKL